MTTQYERTDFIPVRAITEPISREPTLYLDYLSAGYLPMLQQISVYTDYQVSSSMEARLDLISNLFYQTPTLWWVIGMYNGITNPIFEVTIGRKLKIPDRNTLDAILQVAVEPSVNQGVVELQ